MIWGITLKEAVSVTFLSYLEMQLDNKTLYVSITTAQMQRICIDSCDKLQETK